MVGHLPFLLGLDCKNALVVGFGIGVTTAAIGVHKDVENIDCIELVKSLTDVAHFYTEINNNIHNDSRLRFYEDDGRHLCKQLIRSTILFQVTLRTLFWVQEVFILTNILNYVVAG